MTEGEMLDRVLGMLSHALGMEADTYGYFFASPQEVAEAAVETIWMYRDLVES